VESAPRAYRLEASNAASSISTMIGTSPVLPRLSNIDNCGAHTLVSMALKAAKAY